MERGFGLSTNPFVLNFEPQTSISSASKKVEVTLKGQKSASTFCTSPPTGFGFLPISVRFDPTYYKFEHSLGFRLVPTDDEVLHAPLLRLRGEKMGLQTWGETEPGGVHQQFSAVESMYKGVEDNGQQQLGPRGCADGIAARTSYEDSHHRFGHYILSDIEHKGAESSVMSAVAQAAVTATNFAMKLLLDGVLCSECIIPTIGNTGLTFVAGVTIVLDKSSPTYIPLSKHLDLSDAVERQIASAYLAKASAHCEKLYDFITTAPRSNDVTDPLQLTVGDTYYIKTLSRDVYQRGVGLFAAHNANHLDVENGIHHMIDALNLVYRSPDSRPYAEYPLSIRTPDGESDGCYQIIYRDLTKLGFRIGAPNRITHEAVYDIFVETLTTAVHSIHKAGVIHVDLYLSNVMWLYNADTNMVEIKIIDWDSSHCLAEGKFVDNVEKLLIDYLGQIMHVHFGAAHDLIYLAVLSLEKDKYSEQWQCLASNRKDLVDSAFRELLGNVLAGL